MNNQPTIKPYHYHVFLCSNTNCDPNGIVSTLHRRLVQRVGHPNDSEAAGCHAICNLSSCLWACKGGPLLVVYPDAIWYHHVDAGVLERIIDEHLLCGRPVEEYIAHRTSTGDVPTMIH